MPEGGSPGFYEGSDGPSDPAAIPAYLTLTGIIKVNVSRSLEYLVSDHDLERGVYLPAPLLEGRLDRYQRLTEGGSSLLWRTVHSELAALLQLRLLAYGSVGPRASDDLLTETDARNAYTLATILLQVACFRACDPKLFESFIPPDGVDLDVQSMERCLEIIGDVDPADIFLTLYGMDEVFPSMLLAQSLYSNADMLAMRWVDYLRVTDALTSLESAVEAGQITGERLLGRLLGRDLTGEKARSWLEGLFDSSGTDELDYRYLFESSLDMDISVQGLEIALRNATGGWTMVMADGLFPVDFQAVDIFDEVRWADFYNDYRRSTSQLLQSITLSIKALALSLSDGISGPLVLTLDPADDLSYIDEVHNGLQTLLEDDGWWSSKESGPSIDLLSIRWVKVS